MGALKNHTIAVLGPVADSLNLSFSPFPADAVTESSGADPAAGRHRSAGHVTLSDAWGTALEPAPVSPTDSEQWRVLAGTIRAAWGPPPALSDHDERAGAQEPLAEPEEVVVVPSLLAGNTGSSARHSIYRGSQPDRARADTQFYWALTPHIFRYNHYYARTGPADGRIHTVNEGASYVRLCGRDYVRAVV